jgi:hypothetical protein
MSAGPAKIGVLLANHVAEDFKVAGGRFALRASHLIVAFHTLWLRHLQCTGGVTETHGHVALGFSRGSLQDVSLVGDLPLHDALGDREAPFFVEVRSYLVKPQQGAILGRPLHAPAEATVLR